MKEILDRLTYQVGSNSINFKNVDTNLNEWQIVGKPRSVLKHGRNTVSPYKKLIIRIEKKRYPSKNIRLLC